MSCKLLPLLYYYAHFSVFLNMSDRKINNYNGSGEKVKYASIVMGRYNMDYGSYP